MVIAGDAAPDVEELMTVADDVEGPGRDDLGNTCGVEKGDAEDPVELLDVEEESLAAAPSRLAVDDAIDKGDAEEKKYDRNELSTCFVNSNLIS